MDGICWDEKKFESCCKQLSFSEKWQKKFESPMPLIGVYIAAASLVCSLAMAADVIHGIRKKKLWFPCKFFTINAASLAILTVAMKLPVDLTTGMWCKTDHLAHLCSNVFMTIAMGNLLTSFASMGDNAIFLNIIALGILVVTIIVNVCVEIRNETLDKFIWAEEIFVIISKLVLFLILTSSALSTPTTKRYLDLKCSELNQKASNRVKMDGTGKLTNQKLKEVVEKYWVMAETGSPQFVMARSVNAATSGVICLLSALTLVEALIRFHYYELEYVPILESPYQWSTSWILWIQFMGVGVGTVAPLFRWFTLVSLNFSEGDRNNQQNESKLVETYWIQRLVEWKERPLAVQIRSLKCRKFIHFTKNIVLDLCICIQFGIVIASKVIHFFSVICVRRLFLFCVDYCKKLKWSLLFESHAPSPVEPRNAEPAETLVTELSLGDYVLQLEGEAFKAKLPKIHCDVNQKGKRQQLKNMIELLRKSSDKFKGVAEFDSSRVPNILHLKLPNCWTLPVVTLTSLAIALPNIKNQMADKLLLSVSECLVYARHVEESFSSKGDDFLNAVKQATDVIWVGVEHYRKWLSEDLQKLALERKTSKVTLQGLVDIAKTTIIEFRKNKKAGILMENPLSWPVNVIAANSMYRISQTILNKYEGVTLQTDEDLFEHLCCMIADILGACLTNLPHVIILKCYCSAIEERERSVREAACLLGEAEEILEVLRGHDVPSPKGDRAAFIDEWRACKEVEITPSACVGLSNHEEMAASCSGEMHITMDE